MGCSWKLMSLFVPLRFPVGTLLIHTIAQNALIDLLPMVATHIRWNVPGSNPGKFEENIAMTKLAAIGD